MTRAEYVEAHGCEPHDEGYWGSGGVNVAGRWGGRVHLSRGSWDRRRDPPLSPMQFRPRPGIGSAVFPAQRIHVARQDENWQALENASDGKIVSTDASR